MKRYRAPKAKDGEIKAQWGKLPDDVPQICFAWGNWEHGTMKPEVNLLHYLLTLDVHEGNNILEELEKRGYDLTTFKISIQKKQKT